MDQQLQQWIRKIRQGDKGAFEKLFLRLYEPLCNFAWRYVKSSHISEELVQDAFLAVWESRESLDKEKNIKTYLFQTVRNKALNHLKHQEVAEEHNKHIEWLNSVSISQIHDFEEDSEFIKAAQEAIEDLPERACLIYKLNRKEGLTYKEIAEILDISPRTVESQMSRALKKLKQSLSKFITGDNSLHLNE
ncbi:MAG TPA: RNA polymerase sigma-70 factor [Balneolaceae bacterium]|nr:RNA polymerase sigma-70 factor [Balneolaceae bacterium]